ncbi:MAG: S9 family peptidase [Anaerolineales bacterium]|nr:S9 family peptidase [Anaerolineales bacterium]
MGFNLSPNGDRLAFSWNPSGNWELFETSPRGRMKPVPLTQGPGGKFQPLYAPDGTRLAYAVDYEGGEQYHIFVRNLADGREVDLTPEDDASAHPFFAWSPDGEQIAFLSDRRGQFDVYLIPAGGGEARLVFDAGFPAWKVRWSPAGGWLAVEVEASGQDYATFVVPLDGSPERRIEMGGAPIDARDAAWSPDGERLAFCSNADGHYQIGLYDVRSGAIDWLTRGEGRKSHPAWSPDGSSLVYILTRGTVSWLILHPLGGEEQRFQIEPGSIYIPRFTPDGRQVIFAFDNPRHPPDLWALTIADGELAQLTHSLPSHLAQADFCMPEEITYPGMDGVPVPALLYRPPGPGPQPAALVIHGGPNWHFEMSWYPLKAHMASRGWIVLAPNYRGSTGYGRGWQYASQFDYGGVDTDDIAAGAHYLVREGLADPGRIGVTGRSHGGYLTASCLTRYPDLWAAGAAVVPFLNWFSNHFDVRSDLRHWDRENFGDPVRDAELWRERSPSFFLDQIQSPLQLICGRQDVRCPISDSIEAHATLTDLGRESELIIYEDEGHAFLKVENVLDSELRRVAFLAQALERE